GDLPAAKHKWRLKLDLHLALGLRSRLGFVSRLMRSVHECGRRCVATGLRVRGVRHLQFRSRLFFRDDWRRRVGRGEDGLLASWTPAGCFGMLNRIEAPLAKEDFLAGLDLVRSIA